jgi:hypothetical protein
MTIELTTATRTLSVKVSGKLSADDYHTLEPEVDNLISSVGKIRILFVMHDFHGWDAGAVWEDIKFATRHCRDIEKIAMVGETTWEKWMAAICKPFTMSSIKYFDAGDEAAAHTWLAED